MGLHAAEVFAKSKYVSRSVLRILHAGLSDVRHSAATTIQVVLSTAHPAKFAEAVQRAHTSFDPDTVFGDLLSRERRVEAIIGAEEELLVLVKDAIDRVASRQYL